MSGVPRWAVKGAKCVCVNFSFGAARHFHPERIYTVAWSDGEFLYFDEPDTRPKHCTGGWVPSRFRPLVTRTQEQDIAEHFSGYLHETRRAPESVG